MSDYLVALHKIKTGAETNTTVVLFHAEARAILAALDKSPTLAPPTSSESIARDKEDQLKRDNALPVRRSRKEW